MHIYKHRVLRLLYYNALCAIEVLRLLYHNVLCAIEAKGLRSGDRLAEFNFLFPQGLAIFMKRWQVCS